MAVCVGPEFSVDSDGRLRAHLCGDPTAAPWPYPCLPGDGNPLRYDEECGLWLPPYPKVGFASANGATAGGYVTCPTALTQIETASITIANPSTCYSATVFRFVTVDVDFNIAHSDGRAGTAIDGDVVWLFENPGSSFEMSGVHSQYTHPVPGGSVIPPGGSDTFSNAIQVGLGQGGSSTQYGQARWSVHAIVFAGLS